LAKLNFENSDLPEGIWASNSSPERRTGAPCLFLDRDGVLVREVNYLHRVADVEIEAGVPEIIRFARDQGFAIVVVTNQAGIDRGIFGWDEFEVVEAEISRRLNAVSVHLDLVVACAFHPDYTQGYSLMHRAWRKPGPRMLELSAELLGVDLAKSWLIGDKASDIGAARAAGIAGAIHVATGHGKSEREAALKLAAPDFVVLPAEDLIEARNTLKEVWSL